jgi:transposase
MQAISGNVNDSETFKKTVKSHLRSLKAAYQNTYFIADSTLYTEETVQALAEQQQLFITRVPQKLKDAKGILAEAGDADWMELQNGYAGVWFDSNYGGIQQRWLLIRSPQAETREKHILDAAISKKTERSVIDFKKLMRQKFACDTDANNALQQWINKQEFIRINETRSEYISMEASDNHWSQYISCLSTKMIAGDHNTMMQAPYVAGLALEINKFLI